MATKTLSTGLLTAVIDTSTSWAPPAGLSGVVYPAEITWVRGASVSSLDVRLHLVGLDVDVDVDVGVGSVASVEMPATLGQRVGARLALRVVDANEACFQ